MSTETVVGLFNGVYDTPCGGRVTSAMRLHEDGTLEMCPNANIPSGGALSPALPTDGWLDMTEVFGTFRSPEAVLRYFNSREGWSITEAA